MPMQSFKEVAEANAPDRQVSEVSAVFRDGSILETVYDPEARRTCFAFWQNGTWDYKENHQVGPGRRVVPYTANNTLVRNEIVLLPSTPAEYGSESELVASIRDFIHRYVDVSPLYEDIASYYVLFSWVYDGFNELPYLRVRGEPGTGKTRFLLTVGSLCYKPIFASGASTVSPLFRMIESFRGTMVIDESDFRFSDEKAELVKILNNGNVRGFPVLRSEVNRQGEFNPRAYHVFGPKIVATRGEFEDRALESRFLSEEMGGNRMRDDIPINLPAQHKAEALALRNKLLLFRFRNLNKQRILTDLIDPSLEPRLNQILVPLLSIVGDPAAQKRIRVVARQYQREVIADRGQSSEAQVLEVIQELLTLNGALPVGIKEITARFSDLYADEYQYKISPKWIGNVVRKKLHLKTVKMRGRFAITDAERAKLEQLFERFGLTNDAGPLAEVPKSTPGDDVAL